MGRCEKFYHYETWLNYLITNVTSPAGYILNGQVEWEGEEQGDVGIIMVNENEVTTREGRITYEPQSQSKSSLKPPESASTRTMTQQLTYRARPYKMFLHNTAEALGLEFEQIVEEKRWMKTHLKYKLTGPEKAIKQWSKIISSLIELTND